MSNLEAQAATKYEQPQDLNSSYAATESQPQSRVASIATASGQDVALPTMFLLSADDLRRALARVGVARNDRTELRFRNSQLLVRKCSDSITCQAAVRLSEPIGEPISFAMQDAELARLDSIQGALRVDVHGSEYDREVVFSGTRADLTEVDFVVRPEPLWDDDAFSSPTGKMLPVALLSEAMRVIQPFARKGKRDPWDRSGRTDLVKITKYGFGCNSPDYEYVFFDAADLEKSPWSVPVEILPKLRKVTRHFKSVGVSVDGASTCVFDGTGSFIAWVTPDDIDAKFQCHALKLDQFVARVCAKDLERVFKDIRSRVKDIETVVSLRVSPEDGRVWFDTVVDGDVVESPSAPIEIERNTLGVDIVPKFAVDSLRKMFTGTKATSIQIRLYHAKMESGREVWFLRSIDDYSLTKGREARKANGGSQLHQCTVTRFTVGRRPWRVAQMA
jgi:hypothetical protein